MGIPKNLAKAKQLAVYWDNYINYLTSLDDRQLKVGQGKPKPPPNGSFRSCFTHRADFTKFDDVYRLLIAPKYYVENLTIHVYEYVGSAYYEVESRLDVIEGKIDQLM